MTLPQLTPAGEKGFPDGKEQLAGRPVQPQTLSIVDNGETDKQAPILLRIATALSLAQARRKKVPRTSARAERGSNLRFIAVLN